jgi:hypothetical protein
MLSEKEPARLPKLELELGPELTAGLDRLYGRFPRPKPKKIPRLDEEARVWRGQIADEMHEAMLRLGLNTVDRLSLPVEARPGVTTVIRNTLLGHMKDTPTLDIIPKGSRIDGGKMKGDPLWRYVYPQLTLGEISHAVEKLTTLGRLVRPGFLETLDSLREVTLTDWKLIAGIGDSKGEFIHEAVKKIEVPGK